MLRLSALLAGAVALLLTAAPAPAPALAAQGPFGKEGRWITDDAGRAVVVQGFNVVNKLPPYTPQAMGFGRDDVAFLRREGFDTIRLGVIWKGLEPTPGRYDEGYLDALERTYDLLAASGFAVMLDFHQDLYNERFEGEGLPDWTVVGEAATLPAEPKAGFPANYLVMPALQKAFDLFWANTPAADGRPVWDAYADAWRHVARRFAGKPRLLGYNLMNEPFPGTKGLDCVATVDGCPDFDRSALTAFHRTLTRAIRAVDRRAIVWYAPFLTFDFGARTGHGDLGENVGFAFNMYCPGEPISSFFPFHAGKSCRELVDFVFGEATAQAARHDDAVLSTEWGATDELAAIALYADGLDRHMLSWQQWAYWNTDPSGPKPVEGIIRDPKRPPTWANVKVGKLAISARPHPMAVAGTPTGWRFVRGSRRFTLRYVTTRPGSRRARFRPGATTLVRVPRRQYPRGYRVNVSGARVVSAPGASVLRLRSCTGARAVRVTVTRGTTPRTERRCPAG